MTGLAERPPRAVSLLRTPEYATLVASHLVSLVGDQLARVALTLLVFERTRSPLLSAVTYAATFLPVVLGGPLLGGLADRVARRSLLVTIDLVRAAVIATMAVPGLPLPVLLALVVGAVTLEGPWAAARAPLLREVLVDEDGYQRGTGLDEALNQSGQVLGFLGAGLLLAVLDPSVALLLDAVSFALSALLLRVGLHHRPPVAAPHLPHPTRGGLAAALHRGAEDAAVGWHAALARGCRRAVLLTWVTVSCAIAPEALATPWAASLGSGSRGAGVLFAAGPAGTALAVLGVTHVPARRTAALLGPLALLGMVPLAVCLLHPPLPVAVGLVALSGVGLSCSLLARVTFIRTVDRSASGRAFAVAAAGVTGLQGLGVAAAGVLAALGSAATAVGLVGLAGVGLVLAVLLTSPEPAPAEAVVAATPELAPRRSPRPFSRRSPVEKRLG